MLDIGIGTRASRVPHPDKPSFSLDDDGYYWFLYPLFAQLYEHTAQMVDLYGKAFFEGTSLDALQEVLAQARQQLESQPETWQVSVSLQISPEYKEVFDEVSRTTFLEILDRWKRLVEFAQKHGLGIVCWGD